MTTEQEFRDLLTDKLIDVAEHPEMRKEFSIVFDSHDYTGLFDDDPAYDNNPGGDTQMFFYKDSPMMSGIEQYAFIHYLVMVSIGDRDKIDMKKFASIEQMVEKIDNEWDRFETYRAIYGFKASYYQWKGYKDAYRKAKLGYFRYSPLYTGLGLVYIKDLEEYYDFMVQEKKWEIVYDLAVNLFAETELLNAPLSDINYLVEIHRNFERDELDFLRKVHKDVYIDKIIPKEYFDPKKRKIYFDSNCQEARLCKILRHGIAVAFGYEDCAAIRPKTPKGSFDYLYNKAEKGNKKAMAAIAEAYRTGTGTHANQRLADYWQKRSE